MTLESPKTHTHKAQEELFNFLSNVDNYKSIMPESLENFKKIDDESFLFQLKGMPEIKLIFGEKLSPSLITLNSSESKINFSLTAHINKIDESNCSFSLEFNGDLNPMIQMMVKTPLQSFINDLSNNISKLA